MSDFDWAAAERDLALTTPAVSLRERAAVAHTAAEEAQRRLDEETKYELLAVASDTIMEILGEVNGTDPTVKVTGPGLGYVEVTIDDMRLRVSRTLDAEGDHKVKLSVALSRTSWRDVADLAALGAILAEHPCRLSDDKPRPTQTNFGRKGGELEDGRGQE